MRVQKCLLSIFVCEPTAIVSVQSLFNEVQCGPREENKPFKSAVGMLSSMELIQSLMTVHVYQ